MAVSSNRLVEIEAGPAVPSEGLMPEAFKPTAKTGGLLSSVPDGTPSVRLSDTTSIRLRPIRHPSPQFGLGGFRMSVHLAEEVF
jgi:hypothetical protein